MSVFAAAIWGGIAAISPICPRVRRLQASSHLEMNMDKVESVQIDQSILGRMLDYGDVRILGTGEGFETLRTIASPIELRNSITGTTHKA